MDGAPLPAGTEIGTYRIHSLVGTGAMGRVYLAEHVTLGRQVALKVLRDEHVSNAAVLARFFAEARAVNRIHHENIVEIHDFVSEVGRPSYLIMELLRGRTLADVIDFDGIQPLGWSVSIARQLAAAMSVVHAAGVIHRDLKPDNIFLTERNGRHDFVKLLDFGIAKMDSDEIAVHQTAAGTILGTPEYMSPEQASGTPVDPRTDIYAFGVMLYEMVTGRRPFDGSSFGEMVVLHLTATPEPPSLLPGLPHAIPYDLEDLILGCLEKERRHRPQTMDEVAARLRAIEERLALGVVEAPRPRAPAADTEKILLPRRARWPRALAAVVLLCGGGALAAWDYAGQRLDEISMPRVSWPPPPTPVPLPIPVVPVITVPASEPAAPLAERFVRAAGEVVSPPRRAVRRHSFSPSLDRNGVFDDPYAR